METKIQTNEEYFEAVLAIQPNVIALTNKKLSKKARKLVLADYEKWVLKCRDHALKRCWDSSCPGELEDVLEYKLAEERGASIVTSRCQECGNEYRTQDYEENLDGMKSRLDFKIRARTESIEYAAEDIIDLKKKLKEVQDRKNALHLDHVLYLKLAEEIGSR